MYIKSSRVYGCDPRRRALFHALAKETAARSWQKGLTCVTSPDMADYSLGDKIPFQHKAGANVINGSLRLSRKRVLS